MPPTHLPDTYDRSKETLDNLFSYPENFGIVRREMTVGGQRAVLYYAEALCDTAVTERVLAFCKEHADAPMPETAETFCAQRTSAPVAFPLRKRSFPMIRLPCMPQR